MEWKRYYFRLELEQLPDRIWQKFKSSNILKEMQIEEKSEIVEKIDYLPEPILDQLRHTTREIWDEFTEELKNRKIQEDEWFSAQEDEAWKDL